jgi:mannose-6-phosphate isomerase-like protein (cupin superfamily)
VSRAGAVVQAADVHPDRRAAGAAVRTLFDLESGLVRRLADITPGSQFAGTANAAGELWFVIGGRGSLTIDGHPGLALRPDQGVWLPPSARYELRHDHGDPPADGAELRLDMVTLPAASGASVGGPGDPQTCDLNDCAVEMTGDRRFRVLFGPGRGCSVATQFVGEIPPGRAPDHSHPYDELVLVLDGAGIVHIGGREEALSPGTCTHLPPGVSHCLENTGSATMRVLGVFHPADSPAAKLGQH